MTAAGSAPIPDGSSVRVGLPGATLAFVGVAIAVQLEPEWAAALRFERAALAHGELWRALSGHLVHGPQRLALFDLAAFTLFGAWVESGSRRLFALVLITSALAASLAVFFLTDYEQYVGSSALVGGLLVAAAVRALRSTERRGTRAIALLLLGLFAAKIVFELLGAWPTALGALPAGYESVALAHAAGALGGCWALLPERLLTADANAPPSRPRAPAPDGP